MRKRARRIRRGSILAVTGAGAVFPTVLPLGAGQFAVAVAFVVCAMAALAIFLVDRNAERDVATQSEWWRAGAVAVAH